MKLGLIAALVLPIYAANAWLIFKTHRIERGSSKMADGIQDIDTQLTEIEAEVQALPDLFTKTIADLEAKLATGQDVSAEVTRLKTLSAALKTFTTSIQAVDDSATGAAAQTTGATTGNVAPITGDGAEDVSTEQPATGDTAAAASEKAAE